MTGFDLRVALRALQDQREATQLAGHGYVWINPITKKPFITYRETSGHFRTILRCAGVRYRNQYQIRHTYASNLLSDGENP